MNYRLLFFTLVLLNLSCKEKDKKVQQQEAPNASIEVQGHRGERGLMPENSIQGFIAAINDSVDVIELDVVISEDEKVVVSHEPFMSSLYVLKPSGDSIRRSEESELNLYQMSYDSIRTYDIGLKGNISFPDQQIVSAYKPLLEEVIDSVEHYIKKNHLNPVGYNIELKSDEKQYGISQPEPVKFTDLVMTLIKSKRIAGPVNIQSFDPAILRTMHRKYPEVPLSFLVHKEGIQKNLEQLGFTPEIYSPAYRLVQNKAFVDSIKTLHMKLIPWTVNDRESIKEMIDLQVDGIITDFPHRVIEELR